MTRPKAILAARKLAKEKFFHRAITRREPEDLDWNKVTLECGHSTQEIEGIQCPANEHRDGRVACDDCAKAWIKQQTGKGSEP